MPARNTGNRKNESTPHETMKKPAKRRRMGKRKQAMMMQGKGAQGVRYKT